MQIRPLETFPVVYQISDPSDTSTYYVRAVMRNSATGAIVKIAGLNYVNLTVDSGNSRRFAKNIQAPSDPSGLGFWVDVSVSIYTDAAYTIKSPIYAEDLQKYLILERWTVSQGSGGGYINMDERLKKVIDHARIEGMIETAISKIKPERADPVDLSPVLEGHKALADLIDEKTKPAKPIDLETHTKRIIAALEAQSKQTVDLLNSVNDAFEKALKGMGQSVISNFPEAVDYSSSIEAVKTELTVTFKKAVKELQDRMPTQKYADFMDDVAMRITNHTEKSEDPMKKRLKGLIR